MRFWTELLGIPAEVIAANRAKGFLAHGGDSLMLTQLMARLNHELSGRSDRITIKELHERDSFDGMVSILRKKLGVGSISPSASQQLVPVRPLPERIPQSHI
jgi:Phosphopantetheine attachment site